MTAKCTCIDFSSSIIRLPATHSGWSDFWDVVWQSMKEEEVPLLLGVQEKREKRNLVPV